MRYLLVGLLLAASSAANAVPVRYEISGAISSVMTNGATIPSPFAVGQSVTGWYEIDWDRASGPYGSGPYAIFSGLATYSLDLGPIKFSRTNPTGYSGVDVMFNDSYLGNSGQDLMRLMELGPVASNHGIGAGMFDEIFFDLLDFTGTGFGNSQATADPTKFHSGSIYAQGQVDGYSGLFVRSDISIRKVPEPGTLALMFAGLGAAFMLRRRKSERAAISA